MLIWLASDPQKLVFLCLSTAEITSTYHHAWPFIFNGKWIDQFQILILERQGLYPLCHLLNSICISFWLFFWDNVLLCIDSWPTAYYVDQHNLKLQRSAWFWLPNAGIEGLSNHTWSDVIGLCTQLFVIPNKILPTSVGSGMVAHLLCNFCLLLKIWYFVVVLFLLSKSSLTTILTLFPLFYLFCI